MLAQPIAKNAVTMLVNLTEDGEIIKALSRDANLVELVFSRIVVWPASSLLQLPIDSPLSRQKNPRRIS